MLRFFFVHNYFEQIRIDRWKLRLVNNVSTSMSFVKYLGKEDLAPGHFFFHFPTFYVDIWLVGHILCGFTNHHIMWGNSFWSCCSISMNLFFHNTLCIADVLVQFIQSRLNISSRNYQFHIQQGFLEFVTPKAL